MQNTEFQYLFRQYINNSFTPFQKAIATTVKIFLSSYFLSFRNGI